MNIDGIKNTIICGDCLEVMTQLPDKCVDLVLTDPPYEFISKSPVGGGFMSNENKQHLVKLNDSFGMSYCPEIYLSECKRICKKFNGYFFTNKSLLQKYIGFAEQNKYKWELILWSKPNPVPLNNGHYLFDKEYIVFIKESGAIFNSNLGYNKYFTVKNYPIGIKETEHPTEKPVSLLLDLILISSNSQDVIFDGYSGSGTTAIACYRTRRNFIGIEINPEYCAIANKRLQEEKDKLALFAGQEAV